MMYAGRLKQKLGRTYVPAIKTREVEGQPVDG